MIKKTFLFLLTIFISSCKSYTVENREYESGSYKHVIKKNLQNYDAESSKYSLLLITTEFLGEKILIKENDSILFNAPLKSNPNFGLTKTMRINNTRNLKIYDSIENCIIKLKSKKSKNYKYIYLEKNKFLKDEIGNDSLINGQKVLNRNKIYKVIYSNTLLGFM
jgi:hypothetical protein